MKRLLLTIILFATTFGLIPGRAVADVNDFIINNFEADYYLSSDDPQGAMKVSEKIEVTFTDFNHGILRAIPDEYKSHPLGLTVLSVSDTSGNAWPYEVYEESGNKVVKIGDANKTVTGRQSYVINYRVENVITFYEDYDELYWDVNGDQWQQPFERVVARLHLNGPVAQGLKPGSKCFSGQFGSQNQNCNVAENQSGTETLVAFSTEKLGPSQTLTFVSSFQKNIFSDFTWRDRVNEFRLDIIFGLVALVVLIFAFSRWWRHGKDFKGLGTIIPEYEAPKKMTLAEAGVLQDYAFDAKDITAMIIALAIGGSLKIVEEDSRTLGLFKKTTTKIVLANPDTSALDIHEKSIIEALFDGKLTKDAEYTTGKYNSKLFKAMQKINTELGDKLIKDGVFERTPSKGGSAGLGWLTVLVLLVTISAAIFKAFLGLAVAIVCLLAVIILLGLMPRRSRKGEIANEQLQGLKLFINTTQKDRLKFTQSPNASYARNFHEPKRTVELFEKLLPFAIIFGVEKGWAKQFKDIYQQPPDWYGGNWRTFNTVVLASHLSDSAKSVGSSFNPPSSSGSSGFSGGSAGGGGGGGGGGGW